MSGDVYARVPGSFRDPSGFVFLHDGVVHRQINATCADRYDQLMRSGLYAALADAGDLVAHEEVSAVAPSAVPAWKIIRPRHIPFISYPYEWCFSQLKAAALLTLRAHQRALEHGMVLRDASAYNVQFVDGRPVFIDTLSFGPYVEGEPWVAYQQFCRHFLAPLALMARVDVSLGQLARVHIDGVPLDLASALLPLSTWLSFPLLTHMHLHARSSRKYADIVAEPSPAATRPGLVSKTGMLAIIDSLTSAVSNLDWKPVGTEWGDYYQKTNYTDEAHTHKKELVSSFLARTAPRCVWDLGANTGVFSRIAAEQGARVNSFDVDPAAVEQNWRACVGAKETRILPLLQDLTNPSTGIGWNNDERSSLPARGPADTAMALALVHHLAISNNVPLDRIAEFFHRICRHLIVEFVPKADSQVRRLLATREDVFPDYTLGGFEAAFAPCFSVVERAAIRGSERTLFLLAAR